MSRYNFSWENLKSEYKAYLDAGYEILTCEDYVNRKSNLPDKCLVNRIDVDLSAKKVERLLDIYQDLGIKATFFIRLHAPEYNPFSFENYRIIRRLIEDGHELGYHSEVIDQSELWNEDAEVCLLRDIAIMKAMYGVDVKGIASHGGMTGYNNLDFWKDRKASDYGLLYEAYDHEPSFNLFQEAFYVSDSEWTQWKCYDKGVLQTGDRRCPKDHIADKHPLIYFLIHSDTYYDRHIYE